MMNKKGTIVLRDVMFMIIIFGGVMALTSLAVSELALEYNDASLTSDYSSLTISTLGSTVTGDINKTITSQRAATIGEGEGDTGTVESIGRDATSIGGAASIVKGVFLAPAIVSTAILGMFTDTNYVDNRIVIIMSAMILSLLLIVIMFGIITALLKGGRM